MVNDMPFCPICRAEYREGYTHCAYCEELLTEFHVSSTMPNKMHKKINELVLLCSLSDDTKTSMIMAALGEQGIPALMKERGAGQYLTIFMGFSVFNKGIYVPPHLEAEAREVLNGIFCEDRDALENDLLAKSLGFDDFNDPDDSRFYQAISKRRFIGKLIIAAVLFGPWVIWILYLFHAKLSGHL